MELKEIAEFKKDLKQLLKRFNSLSDDLGVIRKVLTVYPNERPPFGYRIEGLEIQTCIMKIRKIACKSLKGIG